MYRRISVPLDGTSESLEALSLAVGIAREAGCPVELVRVAFPTTYGHELYEATLVSDIDAFRRQAGESLQRIAADTEARGVPAHVVVLTGPIPEALADHFHASGADLVVMTTHDRGRLERLLIGSVAESVVRHVRVPVLLVHAGDGGTMRSHAEPGRHVLIPLDGSAFSEAVIPHAATLASLGHGDITLLTVVQPLLTAQSIATETGAVPGFTTPGPTDGEHSECELVSRVLEDLAQSLRRDGATVRVAVVADANPSRAIVEYAREHDVDLIAMTTHGRGALKRMAAGSVSQAVLHATRTPTLLYRPALQEEESGGAVGAARP